MKHIEFSRLIEKFEGRLTENDELEIASHITGCEQCRSASEKVSNFFAYVGSPASEDVPQAVTANLLNIYQRRPPQAEAEAVRPFCSTFLVFDDWSTAVNERYSGMDTRQMLYEIDNYTLDLRIELVGETCRLSGQLFPECSGASITISSPVHSATVALNEFGEFTFDPVPQDLYDIRLAGGTHEFAVQKVPLKS